MILQTFKHFLIFIIALSKFGSGYLTAAPVWVTSNFFRAGNQNVINTLTGNSSTPEYTFVFSSALTGVPKLAYGIKNYRGNDHLGQEMFQIRRISLTSSTYRVAVQIFGVTNIYILNVPYIAIDPSFPHHLNSFDNVPAQYNAGSLTNITAKSMSQNQYTNTINYTQQASGLTYTSFQSPLDRNKIILYIMALNIFATNEGPGPVWYPIDLFVSATVLTAQTYQLKITLQKNVAITLIHFSQIMYNEADVESSKKYYIMTQYQDFPNQGGFIPLPPQFMDNFIMAITDFSTPRGQSCFNYNWQFQTIDGVFGAKVNHSIPIQASRLGLSALTRQGTMVFYIKTWLCPSGYDFFNLTTNLCQDMCGDYHFENEAVYQCQYCSYTCLDCTSGSDCLSCSGTNDHRILTGDRACSCQLGYYEQQQSTVCQPCEDILPNCVDCFYNTSYSSTDSGSMQYGCFQCTQSTFLANNMCEQFRTCTGTTVLNSQTNQCQGCTIQGCVDCDSMTECAQCDQSANKYLNSVTKQCQGCSIQFCNTCSSASTCSQCKATFTLYYNHCICPSFHFLDLDDQSCQPCSVYCKTCSGPSSFQCQSCYYDQHRMLIGSTCICDQYNYEEPVPGSGDLKCQKKDLLKCDRGYIYISQTDQCIQLCGDGYLIQVQCDDGNILNGDGCSDQCLIQDQFICSTEAGQQSICKLKGPIIIGQTIIEKYPTSNSLIFQLDISPDNSAYNNYNFTEILEFTGADITISEAYYENGKLIIKGSYTESLQGKKVDLKIKQEYLYQSETLQYPDTIYTTSKATFQLASLKEGGLPLKAGNNLDLYYYSDEEYKQYEKADIVTTAATALGLTLAFFALAIKNSLSTMIIVSSIQICFLGLSSVQGLNPISQSMINMKPIVGFNQLDIKEQQEINSLNTRISALKYRESFSNNYNLMLFCNFGLLVLTFLIYMASLKRNSLVMIFKFMQRETMLFIVFNASNTLFSLSIIKQQTSPIDVAFASVSCVLLVGQVIHLLKYGEQYFGMKNCIDFSKYNFTIFLIFYFVLRIANCVILGIGSQDPQWFVVGIIVSQSLLCIAIIVLRPFIHLPNNIFIFCAEILVIAYFTAIYAMQGLKSSQWTSGWIMIGLCIGIGCFGLVNIVYSIYKDCSSDAKYGKTTPVQQESAAVVNFK